MSCKISILIPVYNTEKTVKATLDSVLNQTFKDIEIICVNDGSSDNSLSILNEYKEKFDNIKIISYEVNEGLARARYHGILAASGEYIMFLDSDDTLVPDACEKAYKEISKGKYDIVHFGANVIADEYANKVVVKTTQKYFNSKAKLLKNTEIFGDCIYNRYYNWNVWTKIYRADLVKRITKYIPEERCVMAEDMMIYFFISFFANSFKSIPDKLVNYSFGTGVSTKGMTFNSYKAHLRQLVALKGIKNFINENSLEENEWVMTIYKKLKRDIDQDLIGKLLYDVKLEDAGKAFDEYLQYYSVLDFIKTVSKMPGIKRDDLIRRISKSSFSKPIVKKDIKTIGIFYYRLHNGGIERVISKIVPILLNLGYKVIVFVEQKTKKDFKLPSEVIIETLPHSAYSTYEQYYLHAQEFAMKLTKYKVDLMLYQASVALYLMEEILICKSLNIPFVITTHDYYSSTILAKDKYMTTKRLVYSMCDGVQTITTEEEKFWQALNVRARYIPNPLTFNPRNTVPSKLETNDIIWVGRLDHRQKCPEYAIEAMKYVVKTIPNARLHMIGKGENAETDRGYKNMIVRNNLSQNVIMHGFIKDVENYYSNVSMLLMTSSYEVYPMVIGEAMSYGLPIVMFDLPYVELLKNSKCHLSSPQMDPKKLAQNIIRVLSDDKLRKDMGNASLERIKEVSKFKIKEMWSDFISDISNAKLECSNDPYISTIMDITYDHWERSLGREKDHAFYNNLSMYDPKRYVVLDRKNVDDDLLYSVLLQDKSKLYKAYFFLLTRPSFFLKKIGTKLHIYDEAKAKQKKKLKEKAKKEREKEKLEEKKKLIKEKQEKEKKLEKEKLLLEMEKEEKLRKEKFDKYFPNSNNQQKKG